MLIRVFSSFPVPITKTYRIQYRRQAEELGELVELNYNPVPWIKLIEVSALCKGHYEQDQDNTNKISRLQFTPPCAKASNAFSDWVRANDDIRTDIASVMSLMGNANFGDFLDAWVFGEYLKAPKFQNMILRCMCENNIVESFQSRNAHVLQQNWDVIMASDGKLGPFTTAQ